MTEAHTGENCTNYIDNVTNLNVSSEDEGMINDHESYKKPKSGHETISISESVIVQTNFTTIKKEDVDTKQIKKCITLQNTYLPAILIILMCIVVAILQIPTILYYIDPPSADATLFDNINLESCSVS